MKRRRSTKGLVDPSARAKYVFALPALTFFAVAIAIPFAAGINIAFTDWNGVAKSYHYVGFANFAKLAGDSRIVSPIRNTVLFSALGVVANNVLTLSLALLFDRMRGRLGDFCRLVVFIPCCLSGVLSAFIWKFIYRFVLSTVFGVPSPLGSVTFVIPAIVVISLWCSAGINMLIYYSALKNVPRELYEAALVDGAGAFTRFRRVTIPMIAPAFTICITLTFTNYLREFGNVMAATGGGPARASETISMYIFDNLYTYNKAGYGQAISFAFLVALTLIASAMTAFFRRREVEL